MLVLVNRTDTYLGKRVDTPQTLRLVELVLAAQGEGGAPDDVALVPLEEAAAAPRGGSRPRRWSATGRYSVGPFEEPGELLAVDGELRMHLEFAGTFGLLPVAEELFLVEDTDTWLRIHPPPGAATAESCSGSSGCCAPSAG